MLCLRCSHGLRASGARWVISARVPKSFIQGPAKRTLTSLLSPNRPSISCLSPYFTPTTILPSSGTTTGETQILDLLPKISTHPGLAGVQIRCGPRNTFNPSHFVRKRRHGFLSRIRTRNGRNTLARRRAKKRSTLSH